MNSRCLLAGAQRKEPRPFQFAETGLIEISLVADPLEYHHGPLVVLGGIGDAQIRHKWDKPRSTDERFRSDPSGNMCPYVLSWKKSSFAECLTRTCTATMKFGQ